MALPADIPPPTALAALVEMAERNERDVSSLARQFEQIGQKAADPKTIPSRVTSILLQWQSLFGRIAMTVHEQTEMIKKAAATFRQMQEAYGRIQSENEKILKQYDDLYSNFVEQLHRVAAAPIRADLEKSQLALKVSQDQKAQMFLRLMSLEVWFQRLQSNSS